MLQDLVDRALDAILLEIVEGFPDAGFVEPSLLVQVLPGIRRSKKVPEQMIQGKEIDEFR